ncbi:MAG: thiamine pyrophosphate-binding protein [Candidatus Neomarinimicrobiota bacterium]
MKLTDFIIDFLTRQGVDTVFGLTGGAVVHFFDSAAKHPGLKPVFCHHEQAAALAAPAYAKIRNSPGACIVTTGPGGTNALTGVIGAWQDSVPCFYISGQTRLAHTSRGKPVRQVGSQELDILALVEPVTNYAALVERADSIRYHLEKAAFLATAGRPGPVWLDIPLDLQWAEVDPETMTGFDPDSEFAVVGEIDLTGLVNECRDLLAAAKRPLILAGYGIRLASAEKEFSQLVDELQVPFVSSWAACDLLPTDHPGYVGRCGLAGQRGANLAVQNCDLLLAIGSHLSVPLTGTNFDYFAREAKRIVVDIDHNELAHPTVRVDLGIAADAGDFLRKITESDLISGLSDDWLEQCRVYRKYNAYPAEWIERSGPVNQYVFLQALDAQLTAADTVVVDGGGTVVYTTFQALKMKAGQRILYSGGIGAMGSGLPESVGATFASTGGRTICMMGDGSFQFNIQELQTIRHHNLLVKIFVFNNDGYLSIRHTQAEFLEGNFAGSATAGGMSLPDYQKVAAAYEIPATRVASQAELQEKIRWTLDQPGPAICEIMIDPRQELIPRQGFVRRPDGTGFARPLEDMYPYLDREEFRGLMIVEPLEVSRD